MKKIIAFIVKYWKSFINIFKKRKMTEHIIDYTIFQMVADFTEKGKKFQIQLKNNAWCDVIDIEFFKSSPYFVVNSGGNNILVKIKDIKGSKLIG